MSEAMPSSQPAPNLPAPNLSVPNLQDTEPLVLAKALAQQLAIGPMDWHRLNSNRQVRAKEQIAAALVYLLNDNPDEALPRLEQAVGWLNRSIKAPPCPTHGKRK